MAALVVGYDGSGCAHRALDEAARLAIDIGDAVVIVFGYDPGSVEAPEGASEHREVALLDAAARHGARAIVVGSYGESPLKGAILGSTPHKLLHLSEHPVLVVPTEENEEADG